MEHKLLELATVARLGDAELMAGLHRLVSQDRALTARLLLHLGEVDARGLYREQAFSSMFEYAVEALHMSPDEAYVRLRAAKLAREFPLVLSLLARNELHLSAIKLLAPHLTQANHVELLERARCKSKRAVELIVAELAPKPDVPSVMRKLPAARPAASAGVRARGEIAAAPTQASAREFRLETPMQVTTPLRPGRYKVQFTATQVLHDKLQQLKDLMRHKIPDGELSAIIERAADLLIEQQMKQRFAQTKEVQLRVTPVARPSKVASRYVPRAVRRAVYARDAGQCTFVSAEGRRCAARGPLELHHVKPFARGGAPSVDNLKLACRAHNGLFAQWDYGRAFMQEKRGANSARRSLVPGRVVNLIPTQPGESDARVRQRADSGLGRGGPHEKRAERSS